MTVNNCTSWGILDPDGFGAIKILCRSGVVNLPDRSSTLWLMKQICHHAFTRLPLYVCTNYTVDYSGEQHASVFVHPLWLEMLHDPHKLYTVAGGLSSQRQAIASGQGVGVADSFLKKPACGPHQKDWRPCKHRSTQTKGYCHTRNTFSKALVCKRILKR